MHVFHPSYLAAIVLVGAGLVDAHNGTVWIINQNQSAYESQESFGLHQDASHVLMESASAPSTVYSKWYATLLHPPGEEARIPINCTFRNEGSQKFAQSTKGEVMTAAGEYIWILDPLPVTGWNIKCPQTNLVWTNVGVRYGENVIVLREGDNSISQSFNFRTESGLIE